MSTFYPFILPTTGAVSLSQVVQSIEYGQLILNADEKRAHVRDVLKRAKREDNPDLLGVINSIEDYLPYLLTILDGLDTRQLELVGEVPTFSWRLPMKAATQSKHIRVVEPPRVEIASFEYEKGMTILTYALAIISYGEKTLKQNQTSEKWKIITNRLMKAESVLRYLADQSIGLQPACASVIDLHPSTLSGLITMISGSLHLTIIYKSQAQESASSSLLTRVSLFAAEKFGTATQLFSSLNSGSKFNGTNGLTHWLRAARSFSIAYADKYMADSSQQKGQVGMSIAYLQNAEDALGAVEDSSKSYLQPMVGKLKGYIEDSKKRFVAENDRIAFQNVPNSKEVEGNWPSGREVVQAQPLWVPPRSLLRGVNDLVSEEESTFVEQRGYF